MELIPFLEKYNRSVVEGISRLSDIARDQEEYIERAAEETWKRSACALGPGLARIPRAVFVDSPAGLQQALCRRAIREVAGDLADLAFRHVDQIMEFARAPAASRRMDVALGIRVSLENDWLVFQAPSKTRAIPDWDGRRLPIPGSLAIQFPDWNLTVVEEDATAPPDPDAGPDPWTVRIDLDRIRQPLILRRRRTGDSFFPLGMNGPVKLSNFLSSHHMAFSERDHWPLVCDANGIIWIPGFRVKEGISTSAESLHRLKIQIEKNS